MLKRQTESAHWYLKDGTPYHTCKAKDGTDKPVTLREARTAQALPSVTSLLKAKANPMLEHWKCESAVIASLVLDRKPEETVTEFAQRCIDQAGEDSKTAMALGTQCHDAMQHYLEDGAKSALTEVRKIVDPVYAWIDKNVSNIKGIEQVVVNAEEGYAGRLDFIAEYHGNLAVFDFKTQTVKKKPSFYDTWAWQLEAYNQAISSFHQLVNIIIPVNGYPFGDDCIKLWPVEEQAGYWRAFKACRDLWCTEKRYWPELPFV